MATKDRALRSTSIPYYANVWGYNRTENSDQDISLASFTGDLAKMIPASYFTSEAISTINPIRVLQPQYGDIIEANLNLKFSLASAEGARKFRIAIGKFASRYTAETAYSEQYIDASHAKITGRNTPYDIPPAGSLTIPRVNLYPAMYHRGDVDFRDDAFVVLLCFDQAPSKGAGYTFTKFEIDCTMQMGLY